jgi:glycosyltransferase involved in cell wall biosynthesis
MAAASETIGQLQDKRPPEISVVVPVTERPDDAARLDRDYRAALDRLGRTYELIYVVDGPFGDYRAQLERLRAAGTKLRIVQLGKHFGEAAAIEAGREHSRGAWILTLPAYHQFKPDDLEKLFEQTEQWDMTVGRRHPRTDSRINQSLSIVFHGLVNWMTGADFNDLSCGARLFRRSVADEIPLYGDQHRFLPVLARQRGFRIREVDLKQSSREQFRRLPDLGIYPRRLLDLLSVFFLVKFTKKPLRFFGLIGAGVGSVGGLWMFGLLVQRLAFSEPLAQRPALLLAALLIVLGVQIFALGLVGEIVIYAHARQIREYTVEEIVN